MRILSALLLLFALPAQLTLRPSPPAPTTILAFKNVTVIDMTGAPPRRDVTVVINGNRILALGTTGKVRIPKTARVVDGRGKFLIPGLWDMHVHLLKDRTPLPLFIANGVTGVRSMGGRPEELFPWREQVAAGKLLGPRIVACGPVVDGPKPSNPDHAIAVSTEADGREAVRSLKRGGADFVKVYDGLSRGAYLAIADEAKKQKIPLAGHVPIAVTSFEAANAGQKSFEHLGNILRSSSTLEPEAIERQVIALLKPSNKPNDFTAIPARIAARTKIELETYSEQKAEQLFARFVRNKTWQVPTLATKRSFALVDEGRFFNDPRMKYIPPSQREAWKPENNFFLKYRTPEFIEVRKKLYEKELQLVAAMHRAGVGFMAGTDVPGAYTYPGFSLHDELALFVEAGFTPMEALQAATRNPAMFLDELESSGTVERGKLANLVLLDANPLDDINNTKRINAVILNGKYLSREALQKMLAQVEAAASEK
ncbi:MAG TPA: amidohydrolase family protein [Pyrinomonadaceae bacterium]|jgi:imidazolonepropionase-like amidohydrolase|nr:amidohydrolase family protein [Pyrinomonadaceae bacterium]